MRWMIFFLILSANLVQARTLPVRYNELLPFVQAAPDQGETNTCWFMASTGAMELLLNKRDGIKNPRPNSANDLSESFLIWQENFFDQENPPTHFIEEVVKKFNHKEAVLNVHWPYNAFTPEGSDNMGVWEKHPDFEGLPRKEVPELETKFLFARGRKYATYVLRPEDIETVKKALVTYRSPVIINYNDDGYWHVVLIVGYDDKVKGECYEISPEECNKRGSFFVRDSNGNRFEARAYHWFLYKGNAAAVVKLKHEPRPRPRRRFLIF